MSHLVIARKWRPGVFDEVVGQEHVVRTLTNAVDQGRVGHAYLFSGPRGVGKTTVARILAKCVNCAKALSSTPCAECESCKAITGGVSVDVLEIDGASNTGVDNIRELRENVRYAPSSSRYKVYIIDEVHMLTGAAFNALLKTLEEPPSHVIFIFATTEPHKIPLTIHSRCQRFDFRRIPLATLQTHLAEVAVKEKIEADEAALYLLAREAEGSLRDSQSLLEQVMAFAGAKVSAEDVVEVLGLMDRSILIDLVAAIIGKNGTECLKIVEKIHGFGYDLKKVSAELIEQIRNLAVIKVSVSAAAEAELSDAESERLAAIAGEVSLESLQMLFSILNSAYADVSRSSSPRFSLEMALLKAAHLEDLSPLAEIITELKALKKGIGPAKAGKVPSSGSSGKAALSNAAPAVKRGGGLAGESRAEASIDDKGSKESIKSEKAPKSKAKAKAAQPSTDKSEAGLLEYIKERNGILHNSLKSATLSLKASTLDIRAENAGFLLAKKKSLEDFTRDYFGRKVSINIEKGAQVKGEGKANAEDGDDGVVAEAVRILGGKVIEDQRRSNV